MQMAPLVFLGMLDLLIHLINFLVFLIYFICRLLNSLRLFQPVIQDTWENIILQALHIPIPLKLNPRKDFSKVGLTDIIITSLLKKQGTSLSKPTQVAYRMFPIFLEFIRLQLFQVSLPVTGLLEQSLNLNGLILKRWIILLSFS